MSVFKQVFWTVQLKLDNWSTAWSRDRGHETSTVGGETPCEGRRESYRRNERKQHEDGLRMCEDHHRSQHKDQSSRRATELNDFFNRFDQPLPPPPSPQPLSPSKSLLLLISTPSLPLITTDLVRRQLRKLWPRKTTGLDKVFLLLLRTCAAELGEPLQQIAIKTLFQFWRRIGPVRRAFDNNNHAHALCVCYFMIMSSVQYLVSQLVCVCVCIFWPVAFWFSDSLFWECAWHFYIVQWRCPVEQGADEWVNMNMWIFNYRAKKKRV